MSITRDAVIDIINIAKFIDSTDLVNTNITGDLAPRYQRQVKPRLVDYRTRYGRTPNLLLGDFLKSYLETRKLGDKHTTANLHFKGNALLPYTWACIYQKARDRMAWPYSSSPQLYILVNPEGIKFGLCYGTLVNSDYEMVRFVKTDEQTGHLTGLLQRDRDLKFTNSSVPRRLPTSDELIAVTTIDEVRALWCNKSHVLSYYLEDEIPEDIESRIFRCFDELTSLFVSIPTLAEVPPSGTGQPAGVRAVQETQGLSPQAVACSEYTKEQALTEVFLDADTLEEAIASLLVKKNIVLQGPPGVGKTYLAKRLAYVILGRKDDSKIQTVQFHQSFSYEDFIQGYRPSKEGGFDLKCGVFYTFCRQSQTDGRNRYFFIIDEINRGNLSKIFGELMMLIEYDKRGMDYAIPLIYSQSSDDRFFIPENLHIIGTMNTADRSLAMVDYALRRRFRFIELEPCFASPNYRESLAQAGADDGLISEIVDKMTELNAKIERDRNLGKGFRIGHSYFCPPHGTVADRDWFYTVVNTEVRQLLNEYWFDNPEEAERAVKRLLT